MSVTVEEAKQKVTELVAKYESLSSSQVKAFNEANTKQSFIEPLFKALGWNVDDTNEVMLEEKASNGRVDYAFKLHGVSQFYLEAKSLKADLTNPDYIKQAITYAYNKGVTWVVLTDFEGLRLFNAQQNKPFITLKCQDYLSAFDKLWLLSHDSLADGLLNKEAAQSGALQSTLPVEKRLFRQLRQWREDLFNQLHLYNKDLTFNLIDEVIQRLFDRLIFIRTCEDRGIEDKRLLAAVHQWRTGGHKGELIEPIRRIFRDFDGYYDSDLFARHLTDDVFIMGTTLEEIISGLYEVPGGMTSYDFSIIDADVLGAVYEQYLGYVAQVVKQRAKEAQARMDLGIQTESISLTAKKERRKEQGIYYTPKFVTDYIVKETVGRVLAERSLHEIRNVKILDPACGSGSFLIRAFDELLRFYANQKTSKSEKDIDATDRISILQSNIFGVDLDIQAVEIARLNLLLRSLAKRETLPGLKGNIKQGNSLISGTEEELKGYFGDNWREMFPFKWEQEFKVAMAEGGFDVVIGNPPYVGSLELSKSVLDTTKGFFRAKYKSATGIFDLYVLFLEKAVELAKNNGLISFIVPNKFLVNDYGIGIREILLQNKIVEILDVSNLDVFKDSAVYPVVVIIKKEPPSKDSRVKMGHVGTEGGDISYTIGSQEGWIKSDNKIISMGVSSDITTLLGKIEERSIKLKETAKVLSGTTGFDYANYGKLLSETKKEGSIKFVVSGNIKPYYIDWDKKIHYLKRKFNGAYFNVESKIVSEGRKHLYKTKNKIVIRGMSKRLIAGLDDEGLALAVGVYAIVETKYDSRYILALVNSKVIDFYFKAKFESKHLAGGYLAYNASQLKQIPICKTDLNNSTKKKLHDDLLALAERMLELNKHLALIRDTYSNEKDELEREIKNTDREIDDLVYDLYGLTAEERKIVEREVAK